MKVFTVIVLAIALAVSIFALAGCSQYSTDEETVEIVEPAEEFKFSKYYLDFQDVTNFVSADAENVFNIIVSNDYVSNESFETLCKFLSASAVKNQNYFVKGNIERFNLSPNCFLEIKTRELWLCLENKKEERSLQKLVLSNVDVYYLNEDNLYKTFDTNDIISFGSLAKDGIYRFGKNIYELECSCVVLRDGLHFDSVSGERYFESNNYPGGFTYSSSGYRKFVIYDKENGTLSLLDEKLENGILIVDLNEVKKIGGIMPKIYNIVDSKLDKNFSILDQAYAYMYNSLFFKNDKEQLIKLNIVTGEIEVVKNDMRDYILIKDESGVYWVKGADIITALDNPEMKETFASRNFVFSKCDIPVEHSHTIADISGEEIPFYFLPTN